MASFTENYNLEKPEENEKYNVNVFNSNADIIDSALAEIKNDIGDISLILDNINGEII